jgi:2-methylcitrate dehydratase PrpD
MNPALHPFLQHTTLADLPPAVATQAHICLLDLVSVAVAGSTTPLARLLAEHAVAYLAPGPGTPAARVMFDGRPASPVGAALAGGGLLDSFDAHDGHAGAMGHAGVVLLLALLAFADSGPALSSAELLVTLALGYEVALRAGIALRTVALDQHSSGA